MLRPMTPLEIVGLGKTEIRFVWEDESEDVWSVRDLRIRCVCALCQSEMTGERLLEPETVPHDLTVTHMEFVGNYGLSIHFSDTHSTGIYRLRQLYESRRAS
jgi:ATP-binding protein involved in chromosome partitioning